jgi:hypothetical protein
MIALQDRHPESLVAPLVAGALALTAVLVGWRGVDLPASLYRVSLFHRHGLALWDSQWYGGHWTLNYSVIFPPVAGLLGVQATEVLSAAGAAWAFDRLAVHFFGRVGRIGSVVFTVGTLAQVAIGQLPFLLGEALALAAFLAATRGRWRWALAGALAASLASPLAGSFLVLAGAAWLIAAWPADRGRLGALTATAAVPVVALGALFPGQGQMPFPVSGFIWLIVLCLVVLALVPRRERAVRIAIGLYMMAAILSFALPTPMGGNICRLGQCLGPPLTASLLWYHRRRLLIAAVVPMIILQWMPALATFTSNPHNQSIHRSYFTSMLAYVTEQQNPPGRVEVVPTSLHWEAAYTAPHVALARGWERQLDTAVNPIFYTRGGLTPDSYRGWLIDNGVRYVALPDVPLDYAAIAEGRLLQAGVPGLRLAWRDAHWQVFEVTGAPGLVDGPARLVSMEGSQVVLDVYSPGHITVKVRYNPGWTVVENRACLQRFGEWTMIDAAQPGRLRLDLRLVPTDQNPCRNSP